MKLVSFSVNNYRSITKAHKINLDKTTILVGKNNEGKSNILNALHVATSAIILHSRYGAEIQQSGMAKRFRLYEWNRDFPITLQNRKSGCESIFRLLFKLTDEEAVEFKNTVGIRGNEEIPIDVKVGKDNILKITVPKKGSSSYNVKSQQVAEFISKRISFNYIQAVRTEQMTIDAIQRSIEDEVDSLDEIEEYRQAKDVILRYEKEMLDKISENIKEPLQEFLPNIKAVSIINTRRRDIVRINRDYDVIIDDGTPTSIEMKGDGIKSLAALAILKDRSKTKAASIIAIEEPESHLHPAAIHRIVDVVNGLSEKNQIIITTHNPLFIQRNEITTNIIVDQGKAVAAKNIKEIRDVLGVMPSDNLIDANYVLVVEGEDDKIALTKVLPLISPILKDAIKTNKLVIKAIGGAGNLSSELNTLRGFLCKYFVYLDNDEAGRTAADKAVNKGLLTEAEVKFTICNGSPDSEFEDCYNKVFYCDVIKKKFGVDINVSQFRGNKKWSERMKNTFLSQGCRWSDTVEEKVKMAVVSVLPDEVNQIFNQNKRSSVDALVQSLESMLR